MIMGIGVDVVEIERFKKWRHYSYGQFRKIFSEQELKDCLASVY